MFEEVHESSSLSTSPSERGQSPSAGKEDVDAAGVEKGGAGGPAVTQISAKFTVT